METTPSELSPELRLMVWRRDHFRCQECGVAVGGRGCKPQTHHIVPREAGGTDDPANLVTLCFPCHATKASFGHRQLLAEMPPELLTDFIKHWTWDLATNLLGAAEAMDPRQFPAQAVLANLHTWRRYLDLIISEAERVEEERSIHVRDGDQLELMGGDSRGLPAVLLGVEKAWFADVMQRYLDGEIAESKRQWRTALQKRPSDQAARGTDE